MKTSKKRFVKVCIAVLSVMLFVTACGSSPSVSVTKDAKESKDAIHLVEQLPEVIEFSETLKAAGKTLSIEAEDGDDVWSVHVFEIVTDGDASHTATFGWWQVNKATGKVVNDFE